MENIKQLMANVDSYMTRLIEAVELIEAGDSPHSEGQFSFSFCFCVSLLRIQQIGASQMNKNPRQGRSGINNQSKRRNENIFMNFGTVHINTQQKILASYCESWFAC